MPAASAASIAFGSSVKPSYKFAKAKAILSLDCDFLGTEEAAFENISGFAAGRRIKDDHKENPAEVMNRLYSVEGVLSLTGIASAYLNRLPSARLLRPTLALKLTDENQPAGGMSAKIAALKAEAAKFRAEAAELGSR